MTTNRTPEDDHAGSSDRRQPSAFDLKYHRAGLASAVGECVSAVDAMLDRAGPSYRRLGEIADLLTANPTQPLTAADAELVILALNIARESWGIKSGRELLQRSAEPKLK